MREDAPRRATDDWPSILGSILIIDTTVEVYNAKDED